jgi:hypothetical protein
MPVEGFLAEYPAAIRKQANTLRALVRRAVPAAVERVRPGWRLIGYDVPAGQRTRYFAYVAPEPGHVHLGFEYGTLMADPAAMLQGAHLRLRKVRYLTFQPGQQIPAAAVVELVEEAARLAVMSRSERMSIVINRDW